jgi:hypothetical protein
LNLPILAIPQKVAQKYFFLIIFRDKSVALTYHTAFLICTLQRHKKNQGGKKWPNALFVELKLPWQPTLKKEK